MATVSTKELSTRLSKRLANFKLSNAVIEELANRVVIDGLYIGRFDPCIYGICIDYFSDKLPRLEGLTPARGIVKWEVFPYGITGWDQFRVHIAFQVDELEGKGAIRNFVN
jgi:hypothetical protein